MWSCCMKTRYDEPSIRISIIITDREHIFRWGKTHPSHERFSHPKWGQSWQCRRSVGCITATNDGLPEKPHSTRLCAAPSWGFEISVRTVLPCTPVPRRISFARLKLDCKLLRLCGSSRGTACEVGCTDFSLGTGGHWYELMCLSVAKESHTLTEASTPREIPRNRQPSVALSNRGYGGLLG